MPSFSTTYLTRQGRRRVEILDAVDAVMVREMLGRRGCWVFTVKPHHNTRYNHSTLRVKNKSLIVALEALSLLVSAGASVDRAMRATVERSPKGPLRYVLTYITESTERGDFAGSFSQFPNVFPETVVEIMKANQASGDIAKGFSQICEYYNRAEEIRSNVMRGLFLPAIGMLAFLGSFSVTFGFTLPQFKKVFTEIMPADKMPAITRFFFAISDFVVKHPILLIGTLLSITIGSWWLLRRRVIKRWVMKAVSRLPILGPAIQATALARFSISYADLTSNGFNPVEVLEICSRVVANVYIGASILRVRDSILHEVSIGDAFAKESAVFPPEFLTAVSIGQEDLSGVFVKLAEHYTKESKHRIDVAIDALEPTMVVFLGMFALLSGIAVVLPIASMMQNLR